MQTKSILVDEARLYLEKLDLSYLISSMCSTNYPLPRWTYEDATYCSQLYKNFLLLQKIHISFPLVPTREIDEFWHNHILHTRFYLRDCENIFGHYLHHEPASPSEDATKLIDNFERTKAFYFEAFNEPLLLIKRT